MAKPLEKKSAKVLALILALIMLGSVLVYAFKGTYTTPSREVKYSVSDAMEMLKLVSDSSKVYYLNFKTGDLNMVQLINTYWQALSQDSVFRYLRLTSVNSTLYAEYPPTSLGYYPYLFLFDVGKSKVFFTYDKKEEYAGVVLKVKKGYGLAENVNPVALGTIDAVMNYIDALSGRRGVNSTYAEYIDRLPKLDYDFIIMFTGKSASNIVRSSNATGEMADFYFEGISVNKSGGYDKVVAMNFKQNVFFVESNVTEYYNVTRYGSLNIVFMHDTNFTKILSAKPEMRAVFIKPVETRGNES